MKYSVVFTTKFKKSYKLMRKRGYMMQRLNDVVALLSEGKSLPQECKDHALIGNWQGHRECHIEPDWLLVYYMDDEVLVLTLTATGTHSDLF